VRLERVAFERNRSAVPIKRVNLLYVIVDDVDADYARAKAAGGEIVFDIMDEDDGGRGYAWRDPEGRRWSFGSYDPWTDA